MKFTLSWLKDYLDTNQDIEIISDKLTDIGLEIEEVENKAKSLEVFTVAKIIDANPHPDADKLQICSVDAGQSEPLQIVCGAKNARKGIKVIYAKIGAIIPNGEFKIKKSKIRGVESSGMLCSASELGIGEDGDGIQEVDDKWDVGSKITEIYGLNDAVIDINITPNRGDCLGIYGIARDLSSAGLGKLIEPKINAPKGSYDSPIKVEIDKETLSDCPYFGGYYIKNVQNKPTPDFIKKRLEAIGINSISAIVDITNYVMLCLNQPLHAYDADKIKGKITVKNAKSGTKYTSLKDIEYELNGGEILVCDDEKIAGLAGIVGGGTTTTELDTKNIFLEAAYFNGVTIAKAGRKLNILSDSRYRFERNIDIKGVKKALDMAANLIVEICGGEVSKLVEAGSDKKELTKIKFNFTKIKQHLNVEINDAEVRTILTNLGFGIEDLSKSEIEITVPSFRSDVTIVEDILEEIIRIYGYNKIESQALKNVTYKEADKSNFSSVRVKLCNLGLDEVINYSFIDSTQAVNFAQINPSLLVANAISEEMNYMRPTLLVGLINAAKKNQLRGFSDLSLFEVGRIFHDTNVKSQNIAVSAIRLGKTKAKNHYKDERSFDVMDVKKDLFETIKELGVNPKSLQISQEADNNELPSYYHPYKSAVVKMGKNIVAYFGEIHPLINKKLDVKGKINAFELFTQNIPGSKAKSGKKAFIKSDFQTVNRDFAFIFDRDVKISNITKIVKNSDPELISEVRVFDIYEGDNIGQNKKSIAFNIEIVPKLSTLTSQEIEEISEKIVKSISTKLNGTLRDA